MGYFKHKHIVKANIVLSILILTCLFLVKKNADARTKQRMKRSKTESQKTTKPVDQNKVFARLEAPVLPSFETRTGTGLGFFKPKLREERPMYFYGNPNFEKSLNEHLPSDSIVFNRNKTQFQIKSAPPWLMPEHLKLDYELLYFKVLSIGEEFLLVEVNNSTGYTMYVSRWDGELIFWPDFLLKVHSIEFINPSEQKVRIKPLQNASIVNVAFDFMKPILINADWVQVVLFDSDYTKKGMGWIQWKKDHQLLISYSLLS